MAQNYITLVFADEKTGSYSTMTKIYEQDDPELDAAPNMKYFIAMFVGETPEESINLAHLHINNLQSKEPINFKKIRELSKKRLDGSWISYPDGSKVLILPKEKK